MTIKKVRISKISALHYYKLFFRSALFLAALICYIFIRIEYPKMTFDTFMQERHSIITISIIGVIFIIEMLLRFFPSSIESMGCQKQFKRNYIEESPEAPIPSRWRSTLAVALAWIGLNGVIGVLYFVGLIDAGILILISLLFSICDMICILFFCPFQTWFMKNKCCGSCRIYNWDYAMMFTPLIFIPNVYTYTVLGIAILLLITWEISYAMHPERFSEAKNACLSCANCKEKLCHHKKQLRSFLKKHREILILKGNTVIEKAKNKFSKNRK